MKKNYKVPVIIFLCFAFSACRQESGFNENVNGMIVSPVPTQNNIVIRPNNFDIVRTGEKFPIQFRLDASIEKVNIQLYNGDVFVNTIVKGTYNDGLFKWNIPKGLKESGSYRIKIMSSRDSSQFGSSAFFELLN